MAAIDILCNDFTPAGIRKNYAENEEEKSRFEQVGRHHNFVGYEPPEFLKRMDAIGVETLLVCAIQTWSYKEQKPLESSSVEEIVAVVRQAPKRLHGLYGVNVHRGMKGVAEFERAVREHGFKGLHIHPHGYGLPPDHAYYFPYYAKAQELKVPAVISMGHTLDLMPNDPGRPIHLDKVALYFSDLAVVCTHTGWPWTEEAIALAWKHPNLFLGTSAHAPKYWKPELVKFINSHGQDKVMWGTDYPLIDHKESLQQIEALGLKESSKEKFLRKNAARVFGL
ncbi:MAG TPA: amidohydrolase family protein [Hypericibacter adhaerens]|uniref:amidohydrolase family protein n=1 Tax=Hypericibacter adhaerens TaxID=2602016 RepID=UPI002BE8750F|nr:amidohydrolase family protein [Hypericibacter adhaerens]HWA46291.1 amidohydrolase family protein [Hypericibacter adhaerens]